MKYGHLELHIEELLKEKGISKNTICKELDIPRSNFNRYCRNEFQRLDAQLICKLCSYLEQQQYICGNGEFNRYSNCKISRICNHNRNSKRRKLCKRLL